MALPWFSPALRFSIVVSCNLQAEASVTGPEQAAAWSISKEVFFLWYFRKKLRARATRNKENNNSGLKGKRKKEKRKWKMNLSCMNWRKLSWKLQSTKLKWEELAWVRHSSAWEELDKFKCLEAKCRENPWRVRARTYGTKSPSRSEALRFIDSTKSPSTYIHVNGDLAESIKRSASDQLGDLVP